jgi:predicted RNA-binding protein with PUA-like domain
MATFLLKTEPGEFSFADLRAAGRTTWDGIANAAALGHLRAARKGDQAFIYHTGDDKAIVGLAEFVSNPREDPANPGLTAAGLIKTPVIDVRAVRPAKQPVTLAQLKADRRFADFALIRQSRLSVMPVPPDLDAIIRGLAGL